MPPRRSHKKSRAGCKRCKLRKIKCDEIHPRCGNCVKHGVECDFDNPSVAAELLLLAGTLTPVPKSEEAASSSGPAPLRTTFSAPSSDSMSVSPPLTAANLSPQTAADSNMIKTPLSLSSAFNVAASASTPPLLWPSPSLVAAPISNDMNNNDDISNNDISNHDISNAHLYSPSPSPLLPPSLPLQPPHQSGTPASSTVGRLLEMRVLHQYVTSTYKTLPIEPSPRSDEIWQSIVPRFAFASTEAPYLMDALLSVAAMHLRSMDPNDMDVVRACHTYMVSSVAEYRAALSGGINDSNAEALFLTATLISFQSTASRFFLKDDATLDEDGDMEMEYFHPDQDYADEPYVPQSSNRTRSSYTLPLSWFHSFQGVKTIVATSWVKLRHSTAVQFIVDSQPILKLDLDAVTVAGGGPYCTDETASLASLSFFGHLLDGINDELAVEDDEDAGLGHLTRQSYLHAVAVLNWAHKSPHRSAALAFPATVAKRFLDLVEVRRPRALAILACFFALLKPLDEIWWLKDVARREVMGIVSLFERGSPWWRHLEWPVRIALFEGTDIPSDIWGADCSEERRLSLLNRASGQTDSVVDHIEMFTQAQAASVALGYAPV